jgi:hypothetical protein
MHVQNILIIPLFISGLTELRCNNGNGTSCPEILPMISACTLNVGRPWLIFLSLFVIYQNCNTFYRSACVGCTLQPSSTSFNWLAAQIMVAVMWHHALQYLHSISCCHVDSFHIPVLHCHEKTQAAFQQELCWKQSCRTKVGYNLN